jgi:hypothetical protein
MEKKIEKKDEKDGFNQDPALFLHWVRAPFPKTGPQIFPLL